MNNFAAFFHMCTMEVVAAIGSAPHVVAALDQQFSRVASGVLAALTGVTMFVTGSIAQLLPGDQLAAVATVYDGAPTQQYTATTSPFGDGSALSAGQDRSMRDTALGQNGYVVNTYYPRTTQTIIQTLPQNEYVTTSLLGSVLNDLAASFDNKLSSLTAPAQAIPQQIAAGGNGGYAASNAISTLANTTINSPSVSGGSISNASVSATTLSAGESSLGSTTVTSLLVTSNSTLNGTLGLGGTLTGTDANFSGTLTAGSLSVSGVSSGGAITAPYFSATNTAATSSFQGLTSVFSNITSGIISTLTSTVATITNLVATNATTTNATTTSLAITGLTNSLLSTNSLGSVVATTSPTAVSFTATGASATSTFAGGLIGPNNFVIQQGSGNVGIGTASPGAPLTVNLNASTPQTPPSGTVIDLVGKDSTQARFLFDSYNQSGQFVFRRANTSAASPSALVSGDNIGFITGMGYGATSYSTLGHGGFAIDAAENWTDSAQGTQLRFLTVPAGSTSQTERMRIDASGNVGIGTTNPTAMNASARLSVAGTGAQIIVASTTDTTTASQAAFNSYTDSSIFSIANHGSARTLSRYGLTLGGWSEITDFNNTGTSNGFVLGTNGFAPLVFGTNNAERVRIDSSGNVGIGTTTPGLPLVVQRSGDNQEILRVAQTSGSQTAGMGIDGAGTYYGTALFLNGNKNFVVESNYGAIIGSTYLGSGLSGSSAPANGLIVEGNVGIGTTSPVSKLAINAGVNDGLTIGGSSGNWLALAPTNRSAWRIAHGSNSFQIQNDWDGDGFGVFNNIVTIEDYASGGEVLRITSTGNVGIGTTNPSTFKLQVAGNIGPDASNSYNLGAAGSNWGCLYYNGGTTGTCASDVRLKTNIQDLTFADPLAQIAGLHLRSFAYKTAPDNTYHGLIAQEAETVAPELVVTDASTTLKAVKYGDIQWLMFSALQALIQKMSDLAATVASFADHFATKELTFDRATGNQLCLKDSTGTPVCITGDDLRAFEAARGVNTSGQTATAGSTQGSNPSNSSGQAATLTVNGNDPAQWQVGQAWTDNLGALFTHAGASETIYSTSTVDTSAVGTTTIDYWATWYPDPSAASSSQTLHATRDVVIYDPHPTTVSNADALGPFAPLPEASPASTSPTTL